MASTDVADLLFRFQQIQADDHEDLIHRFCELIPASIPENAAFYLESFNWYGLKLMYNLLNYN